MSQRPGYIPLQYGLTPARGRPFGYERDSGVYNRYGATGQPSYFGGYSKTIGPAAPAQNTSANTPMGVTPQDIGPVRGAGPMPLNRPMNGITEMMPPQERQQFQNLRAAQAGPMGNLRAQQQAQWQADSGMPHTGGQLTVDGGPDQYRYQPGGTSAVYNWNTGRPVPPPPGQATGLLSEPPRRGQQIRNMQQRLANYQAGAGSNPEFDQNQVDRMQGRLQYLNRMRRSGR